MRKVSLSSGFTTFENQTRGLHFYADNSGEDIFKTNRNFLKKRREPLCLTAVESVLDILRCVGTFNYEECSVNRLCAIACGPDAIPTNFETPRRLPGKRVCL